MANVERTERVRTFRPERRSDDPRPASRLRQRPPTDLARVGPPRPHYEILRALHRGGMGEILLARVVGAEGFQRQVVLKGLLCNLDGDPTSHHLFMREARLMAQLDHPNVVKVFDLPVLDGRTYLAMEHIRGRNLHQLIQLQHRDGAEPFPLRLLVHVLSEAIRGLHYAHALRDAEGQPLGLVHRDVSPGNILVSFFGEVKLTDFGIARVKGSKKLTAPRSIRGKARYVSPEQVHGYPATHLSDVYAAGVVLAEVLLGRPLWDGATVSDTLLAIVTEPRSKTVDRVLEAHAETPGLRAALSRALALRPEDRFRSALEFAEALEVVGAHLGPPVSAVELGLAMRSAYGDDEDVPEGDGFGRSGVPPPSLGLEEIDPDPTEVALPDEDTIPTPREQPEARERAEDVAPREPAPLTDSTLVGYESLLASGHAGTPEVGSFSALVPASLDLEDHPDTRPMTADELRAIVESAEASLPCAEIRLSQPMQGSSSVGASIYTGVSLTPEGPPRHSMIRAREASEIDAVALPFAQTLAEARAALRELESARVAEPMTQPGRLELQPSPPPSLRPLPERAPSSLSTGAGPFVSESPDARPCPEAPPLQRRAVSLGRELRPAAAAPGFVTGPTEPPPLRRPALHRESAWRPLPPPSAAMEASVQPVNPAAAPALRMPRVFVAPRVLGQSRFETLRSSSAARLSGVGQWARRAGATVSSLIPRPRRNLPAGPMDSFEPLLLLLFGALLGAVLAIFGSLLALLTGP